MSKKNKMASRNQGYRLRLSDEEFDMLHNCSQHANMKTSDFLRMLVDNYAESNGIMDDESNERYTYGYDHFAIIEAAKQRLIEITNIEDSSEDMSILDNILYRFWQTGCLDQFLEDVERLSKND